MVERLIASLDVDPEFEDAWAAQVERRNAEIESGAVSLVGPSTFSWSIPALVASDFVASIG